MTQTNALNAPLALTLATIPNGQFVGLIVTKKGEEKGRGADRKIYGNDTVRVTLVQGFSYINLVTKSLAEVVTYLSEGNPFVDRFVGMSLRKGIKGKDGAAITHADVEKALTDLRDSYQRTLDGVSTSTTDDVYEPLVVNGKTVPGCRVYTGTEAAPAGTIYLQGLKVQETVLEAAPNGPIPRSNSRGDVVAKNIITSWLPAGRYRSYALTTESDFILASGGLLAASAAVDTTAMDRVNA